MGGQVCVAIRKGETEHVFDAWTNGFNWFLCQPSFRNGGKWYKEYIRRASPKNEWPKTRTIKTIQPIEYGLVLIDLNFQHVWSRQGYATPGSVLAANHDPKACAMLRRLIRARQISHLDYTIKAGDRYIGVARPPTLGELSKALTNGIVCGFIRQDVLFVEHQSERPTTTDLEAAEYWARARGWKSPFRKRREKKAMPGGG